MCQLFETIRIVNGKPANLGLHDKRMNSSRQKLYGKNDILQLSEYIRVPEEFKTGLIRCRVVYGTAIKSIEYSSYIPAQIKTLKLVNADTLIYDLKYLDRNCLSKLIVKSIADDILIVKEGCITDSSFANIVFTDGNYWVTPDTPLLCGTMREKLLSEGIIDTKRITIDDLSRFTHFRLINAMLGFSSGLLPISNII
jgi:4-amino-4-deoxychorismate lyase